MKRRRQNSLWHPLLFKPGKYFSLRLKYSFIFVLFFAFLISFSLLFYSPISDIPFSQTCFYLLKAATRITNVMTCMVKWSWTFAISPAGWRSSYLLFLASLPFVRSWFIVFIHLRDPVLPLPLRLPLSFPFLLSSLSLLSISCMCIFWMLLPDPTGFGSSELSLFAVCMRSRGFWKTLSVFGVWGKEASGWFHGDGAVTHGHVLYWWWFALIFYYYFLIELMFLVVNLTPFS